ncbi:MAG: 3,4-dehydroadipyl-CoA semialdehyde dehydrogenase [Acidobacteriota bacterium]|nr:3,4-dehydroadipyl-CoA semialdehyde dehydrogenase [Acidobacteriota bacterium]
MSDAMKTLRSRLCGQWFEAARDFQTLWNPSTEAPLARASSTGADLPGALSWARERGGPALRDLSFTQRGEILKALGKRFREHREELLALSSTNNGTTATDGAFDIDGAGGALAYYGGLGLALGGRRVLPDGEGSPLGKSENFWAGHALVPRQGVAIHINAFNFPAWGFAEKFACAFLAGVPTITKPATATALVTARMIELAVESGLLPEGALQLIVGSTADLLDRLGPQDVVAFTGSAATARTLRTRPAIVEAGLRFNVEADSLNAAVLAPDVPPGSPTFDRFIADVVREITQKAGQKCTAVRRILAPKEIEEQVTEALVARLATVVTGDPADPRVTMGPVAHGGQLRDALDGIAELLATAQLVHGSGGRAAGVGAPAGKGFFVEPTLLRSAYPREKTPVHWREVFAPVSTLLPYSGTASEAAVIVALGSGSLVSSIYTDDDEWASDYLALGGAFQGRIYFGSATSEGYGSGAALPQSLHGGPGRAGGGEELGGLAGLRLYQQRVALQGTRALVDSLLA